MDPTISELGQLGVMGLWTLSLLYSNSRMRKDFQERYDNLNKEILLAVNDLIQLSEAGFRDIRDHNQRQRIRDRFTSDS